MSWMRTLLNENWLLYTALVCLADGATGPTDVNQLRNAIVKLMLWCGILTFMINLIQIYETIVHQGQVLT